MAEIAEGAVQVGVGKWKPIENKEVAHRVANSINAQMDKRKNLNSPTTPLGARTSYAINRETPALVHSAEEAEKEVQKLNVELQKDPLTGLANKQKYLETLDTEIARVTRGGSDSVLAVMIDVDGFKHFNDTKGHVWGDRVLLLVGETLGKSIREYDLAARFGGDEFTLLQPNASGEEADRIANRLKLLVRDNTRQIPGINQLSFSIGVAVFKRGDSLITAKQLLHRADSAMYNAKLKKGTHVVHWHPRMKENRKVASSRR